MQQDGGQAAPVNDQGAQPEEVSFIETLKRKEEAGMARTRNWLAMWQDSLRYFLSDQLHGKKQHPDWDWIIVNYLWPAIMQEIAKLSRNYKVLAFGKEQSDMEAAEAWQGFLQWQWNKTLHKHGMRIEQLRAMLDGKLYGYRVSKIYWEGKVDWNDKVFPPRWDGEVRCRLWHPAEFWASDKEYIDDGDCGTVRYVELDYAKSQWPDFADSLKEKSVTYPELAASGGQNIRGQTAASGSYPSAGKGGIDTGPISSATNTLLELVLASDRNQGLGDIHQNDRRYCKISETYLKNYAEDEKSQEKPLQPEMLAQVGLIRSGPNGEILKTDGTPMQAEEWPTETIKWSEPKFPRGQYVVRNEDTILNPNEDDQRYRFRSWPFIVIPHYLLPHLWQGTDAITLYRNTQDMINVTVSHLVNNMKQFGDPRIAIEADALAAPPGKQKKAFKIFRGAGSIIRLRRGGLSRYRIENPVPPSAAALQLYGLFAQEYKNLVGLQDIAQGKRSGNITATEAQFLAISANDRITLQNIFEEEWVKQTMSGVAEMDQHYYDIGRFIRVIGEDQVPGGMQITERLKEVQFDVDIESAQSLPFDEEKQIIKYEKAYAMMQNPIPNPMLPEMLRVLGIGGWQKLLAKYEAWQQFVAFEQLYQAVKEGRVSPQDAVQMLVKKVTELYMQERANTVPQQGTEKL